MILDLRFCQGKSKTLVINKKRWSGVGTGRKREKNTQTKRPLSSPPSSLERKKSNYVTLRWILPEGPKGRSLTKFLRHYLKSLDVKFICEDYWNYDHQVLVVTFRSTYLFISSQNGPPCQVRSVSCLHFRTTVVTRSTRTPCPRIPGIETTRSQRRRLFSSRLDVTKTPGRVSIIN